MTDEEIVKSYEDARKSLAQQRSEYLKSAKKVFHDSAKQLFENNPKLTSFGWTQYTPYFNDGDTCTFSVHTYSPHVNGTNYEYEGDTEAEEVGLTSEELKELTGKVEKFLSNWDTDDMYDFFGDHAEITVTKNKIGVDSCHHD